jgi:hypothetical protein
VYELRQFDSRFIDAPQDLANYVSLLGGWSGTNTNSQKTWPGLSGGVVAGTISSWSDAFLIPTGQCYLEDEDKTVAQFTAYLSWTAGGVIGIWSYTVPCFDPQKHKPPEPQQTPTGVPAPTNWPTPIGPPPPAPGHDPSQPPGGAPAPQPGQPGGSGGSGGTGGGGGASGGTGSAANDPHLTTFDGLKYDIQPAGEFQLAEADQFGLVVQARFEPVSSVGIGSAITDVAFQINGHTVEIDTRVPDDGSITLDGQAFTLPAGDYIDLGDGAFLSNDGTTYSARWPGVGDTASLWASQLDVRVYVPKGTDVTGLLGNADGDPTNDLVTSTGEQLPTDTDAATLDGSTPTRGESRPRSRSSRTPTERRHTRTPTCRSRRQS